MPRFAIPRKNGAPSVAGPGALILPEPALPAPIATLPPRDPPPTAKQLNRWSAEKPTFPFRYEN